MSRDGQSCWRLHPWRPRYLTASMKCQVTDVSGARRRDPGFHGGVWFRATLDAVEEIFQVIDGAIPVAASGDNGILFSGHALPVNAEPAAVDLQRRIRAAEFEPAIIDRRIHHSLVHHIEARVAEGGLDR